MAKKGAILSNLIGRRVVLAEDHKATLAKLQAQYREMGWDDLPPLYRWHAALDQAGGGEIAGVRVDPEDGSLTLTLVLDGGMILDGLSVAHLRVVQND